MISGIVVPGRAQPLRQPASVAFTDVHYINLQIALFQAPKQKLFHYSRSLSSGRGNIASIFLCVKATTWSFWCSFECKSLELCQTQATEQNVLIFCVAYCPNLALCLVVEVCNRPKPLLRVVHYLESRSLSQQSMCVASTLLKFLCLIG